MKDLLSLLNYWIFFKEENNANKDTTLFVFNVT